MKFIYIILILSFITACSGESANDSSSGGGGSGGGSGGSGSSSSTTGKLKLVVRRNLKGNNTKTVIETCEIPATAAVPSNLACDVEVEELILHYSDLEFVVSTNNTDSCTEIITTPYFYRKSNSATFRLDGADADTDCTDPSEVLCFGGAGPGFGVLTGSTFTALDFPNNIGYYFLTRNLLSQTYRLISTEERSETNRDRDLTSNTGVTNNLPAGSRSANINTASARYVANTYRDYTVTCRNDFGELNHTITLTIGDFDTQDTSSSTDSFYDWGL